MAIYTTKKGRPVTTQSMLKTFNMCHREAYYKYALRLSPRQQSKPLTRGKWMHSLLENYHMGKDWEKVNKQLTKQFSKLFDEEKEKLGDLPREALSLMESYTWHYGDPAYKHYNNWDVINVEQTIEAKLPNGHLFRGRYDMLIQNEFGLWLVDHKTHKQLPRWEFRMLDKQAPLYIWAARAMDIPVNGFIWNYLCTADMPKPLVLQSGKKFYAKDMANDLDYPTFSKAVKEARKEHGETFLQDEDDRQQVKDRLARLKEQRWRPDEPQTSTHFRRDELVFSDDQIERVVAETTRSSETMHNYDFSNPDCVERSIGACTGFFCSFKSLNMADAVQGDSSMLQKLEYVSKDPLEYYDGNTDLK